MRGVSSQTGERKLAAILSADVFGYSRLMAEDEAATVRTITAYREQVGALVREHRGRVADFSGDNFLAEFTTPLDGLRFSLDLLSEELPLELRIGLHLGEIRDEEGLLFGDTVNIAARIQAFAQPGTVAVTRSVLERAIENCGTTFSDFQDARGVGGSYQRFLRVYDREGQRCRRCRAEIRRVVQQQRSTFYCPDCQE